MLAQRLDVLGDEVPQLALLLAQRAAARRGTRLQHGRTGRSLHCCRWDRFFTGRRGSAAGSITGRGTGSGTGPAVATVSLLSGVATAAGVPLARSFVGPVCGNSLAI